MSMCTARTTATHPHQRHLQLLSSPTQSSFAPSKPASTSHGISLSRHSFRPSGVETRRTDKQPEPHHPPHQRHVNMRGNTKVPPSLTHAAGSRLNTALHTREISLFLWLSPCCSKLFSGPFVLRTLLFCSSAAPSGFLLHLACMLHFASRCIVIIMPRTRRW